jgi:SAM-dependent methyltransferase
MTNRSSGGKIDYDFELRAYNERLRAAAAISPGQHVLDLGCGAGESSRDAARAAAPGHVLGIDISAPLLERARERVAAEGVDNLTFVHGDAQVHPFTPGHYDIAISRFGVMFFSDPVAAFGNVARTLRSQGRLVALAWQPHSDNEWAVEIDSALHGPARPPTPANTDEAFSLGDRAATARILDRAGFRGIEFTDVNEPVFYGRDGDAAFEFVRRFKSTQVALASFSAADAERALERLRDTLEQHRTPHDGIVFDSRAWLITAAPRNRRAPGTAAAT